MGPVLRSTLKDASRDVNATGGARSRFRRGLRGLEDFAEPRPVALREGFWRRCAKPMGGRSIAQAAGPEPAFWTGRHARSWSQPSSNRVFFEN
jgi:hypothetical protein